MTEQVSKSIASLEYCTAGKQDWKDIVALQQKIYPKHGWSSAYVDWEYGKNPAGDPRIWIARSQERELVASYAAVPFRVLMKGREGIGWRMEHLLTHPDYRALGSFHTFAKLSQEFLREIPSGYGFAFPNARSYPGFKAIGWKTVKQIPLFELSGAALKNQKTKETFWSRSIERFETSVHDVWKTYAENFDYALDRTAKYLNWRYFECPHVSYDVQELNDGSEKAFFVLKTYQNSEGKRWAHLCDFFHNSSHAQICQQVLDDSVLYAIQHGCEGLSLWSFADSGLGAVLENRGFSLQPDLNRCFVVFGPTEEKNGIYQEPNRWGMMMGDSDVF
ncbi:MAG: GNAT family N-acetyltransferase [Candidatus Omnitrophica bacterium]|nr:GNAT family N-acetyltransferase [Candidatus Omnitrophota bacterium]